ncbi:fumarate hydratase, partial [Acinetobacter baumannii]
SSASARRTLAFMLDSAEVAEKTGRFVCSDAGIPTYFVRIGTGVRMQGDIKRAIVDGFDHLVQTIDPPILKFVTNPLTNERSYKGKDMPIV